LGRKEMKMNKKQLRNNGNQLMEVGIQLLMGIWEVRISNKELIFMGTR
jgi:hypothetical protein